MAKDLIRFSNDKKGFLTLVVLEALVALWALAAMFYAVRTGRTRTMIYGAITVFAAFYILGRSLRSYRDILRRDKKDAEPGEEKDK